MPIDKPPRLERSLNVSRPSFAEGVEWVYAAPLEYREIDLHDFNHQSMPELPEQFSHLGRINAGAVGCHMGCEHPYANAAFGDAEPDNVVLLRVFIETEDHSHYAVIQVKAFRCLQESPGRFMGHYVDSGRVGAFLTDEGKLTQDAARVWRLSEDQLPDAFVSLQGFYLSQELDTPAFLAYLVEMAKWVVMEHLPWLNHCGFTMEAKGIATEESRYSLFPADEQQKYETMIASALDATKADYELEYQNQSVFLLANSYGPEPRRIRRPERTG